MNRTGISPINTVEDAEQGALPLGGDSIPWPAEDALGLLAGLLCVNETGVGDREQRSSALGADLSSVAKTAGALIGVP